MKQPQYNTALYMRLSRDDESFGDSVSIETQRTVLTQHVREHPEFYVVSEFVDDGWSGTNFDRPQFKRMMEEIEAGNINCVITKDLSRFGREHIMMGYYLEFVFPKLKVRYIAVNDNEDTDKGLSDFVPFKNLIKNKCRLLVRNTFSPKFRQGYIFSHNQTNKPIEHLNILVALTVYNGTLTDFNMVNQFVNDGPV